MDVDNEAIFASSCELHCIVNNSAALAVSGGSGYAAAINGLYEDTGKLHNDKTVYVNIANPAWKLMYCNGEVSYFERYIRDENIRDEAMGSEKAAEVVNAPMRPKMYLPEEHVRNSVLQTGIEAVLKQVHPEMVLGAGALHMIEERILGRFLAILFGPMKMKVQADQADPVGVTDLEAAVKASLPGDGLAKYAVLEMNKAVGEHASGNMTGALVLDSTAVAQVAGELGNHKVGLDKSTGAHIAATAVVEYLCAEILELAGNAAKDRIYERRSRREEALGTTQHSTYRTKQTARKSTGGKAPRKQLAVGKAPRKQPMQPWESAWEELKEQVREIEAKEATQAKDADAGADDDVVLVGAPDVLVACSSDEELYKFMLATEEEGDLDADAAQIQVDDEQAQVTRQNELKYAKESWERYESEREELTERTEEELLRPFRKLERLAKRYEGWVFTQATLTSTKCQAWLDVHCAYMRSVGPHSAKNHVDDAKVDLADGSVSATVLKTLYVDPLEVRQWEVFYADGDNPKTSGFDWRDASTWSTNADPVDANPPQYRLQEEVAITMATEQELEAARERARQVGQRLAAVQEKVRSTTKGNKVDLPAVRVREPSRGYGTFLALPGVLHNDRPVYECPNTKHLSGQPYDSHNYAEYGARNLQLYFDGKEWRCQGNDSSTTMWSIFANGAATPLKVPAGCWEYDDGHYAAWAVGCVTVLPATLPEE